MGLLLIVVLLMARRCDSVRNDPANRAPELWIADYVRILEYSKGDRMSRQAR